eukprot:CAMPEP_0196592108 /NCGR_PEP_ID=MMETSP1081-20130531/71742_1 /TAXON_ID=36882 /ORGANISM="Pyramimonas amylifera, Strain CCMP720" /LENGTH=238 /DNA_ID=CAMNT_0041915687 /DNA_START=320 /DNA_END=1036 /DNA_ORIENTATION=-
MCETKTKDNVFVNIVVSVQYVPAQDETSYYNAFYKLSQPDSQMRAYVFDVVRSCVPQQLLDNVFELKDEIATTIKSALSESMGSFGFQIVEALVTDIQPDSKVKMAMNEINAASRLRVAAQEKAEAEKLVIVKAAEADAESKYLAGLGIARQRQAIVSGLKESVSNFSAQVSGTSAQQVMDMMILTQYFDMLREVGTKGQGSTMLLQQSPSTMSDVARQIRSGFLVREAEASVPSLVN